MSDVSKPIILVDGSSYLYRAFHALPNLTNSTGMPTGAVYGMINMLKKLINDYQPTHMAVVFDTKAKTFRDELYPAYKATREAMPSALSQQIAPIHAIIKAFGIPILTVDGVEADDVIGTLAKQAAKEANVLISTGDKDLAQLVNEHVTLINTMNNTILNPENVKTKFGVPPDLIIDYLTLVGDTSDNIPGVPMVGPKTAEKWLTAYGSLDAIVNAAGSITGKVGENLRNTLAQLPLTKSLVTIKCDVVLPFTLQELHVKTADQAELITLFRQMEFKAWLAEMLAKQPKAPELAHYHPGYETILDETALKKWVDRLTAAKIFAFDTETTSLNYMDARVVGLSFATEKGQAAYVPFGHDYLGAPSQLSKATVYAHLKPLLEDPNHIKIGQNLKYDAEVLANDDIHMQGIGFDTMLQSFVLDSASNAHDMDSLSLKYLGHRPVTFTEIAGKGSKQLTFNQIEIEKAAHYAAEDADVTLQLHQTLFPRIQKESGLLHIFSQIEMPLVPVLVRMERQGVLIDPVLLEEHGKNLQKRLNELEQEAFELAGGPFNLNSPKQLQAILFDQLKLPVISKTPTGQPSTAESVLQELARDFALPNHIIEYRGLSKLISTYTSRLVAQINPATKRVHTSYNQTGAATGRLSSSEPNLQNIPVRSPEGRKIREAFIAPKGFQIVSADYSQIELRLMAHISGDLGLRRAFAEKIDVHTATASEVWDVPLDQVTSDLRRNAKAINFGLIYGMSAFGLTQQLGIDRHSAQAYIDRYFARYPLVLKYMEDTRAKAHERGFVETIWGRRLYLSDINSSQMMRQKAAERAAINAPLQGSAADVIKMAMLRIDHWIQTEKPPVRMIMQVHDELVFEVADEAVATVTQIIQEHMVNAVSLNVPLEVSIGIGPNWDAASAH